MDLPTERMTSSQPSQFFREGVDYSSVASMVHGQGTMLTHYPINNLAGDVTNQPIDIDLFTSYYNQLIGLFQNLTQTGRSENLPLSSLVTPVTNQMPVRPTCDQANQNGYLIGQKPLLNFSIDAIQSSVKNHPDAAGDDDDSLCLESHHFATTIDHSTPIDQSTERSFAKVNVGTGNRRGSRSVRLKSLVQSPVEPPMTLMPPSADTTDQLVTGNDWSDGHDLDPDQPTTGLDPELAEICQFAHYFKLRRLSLGLTQARVGSALNAKEGPAYSQSAICRFEKLDVTPKSAKRMKPILENWLTETESKLKSLQQQLPVPTSSTSSSSHYVGGGIGREGSNVVESSPTSDRDLTVRDSCAQHLPFNVSPIQSYPSLLHRLSSASSTSSSRKRKRRTCFSPNALNRLAEQLSRNPYPSKSDMASLSRQLDYDKEVIRVWFCNRRQALKTDPSCCSSSEKPNLGSPTCSNGSTN